MNRVPWWVWASFALMSALSVTSLVYRYRVEASNRAVGILMEAQALREIGAASGESFSSVLAQLKEHGLVGVALSEDTVQNLVDLGSVTIGPNSEGGYGIVGTPDALARVSRAIARKGGMGSSPEGTATGALRFRGDVRSLLAAPAGLDPQDAKAVRGAGLVLVARHANVIGADAAYVSMLLSESRDLGATAFLAAGDQVLGQRDSIDDTALALQELGFQYLTPEFAKIAGDSRLSAMIPDRTVRLHSMQQAEVDKTSPAGIIERYTKAYRERNVRWLLVRPVSYGGPAVLPATARFLDSIRSGVASERGGVKPPRPFTEPGVPSLVFVGIGLFAAPWLAWTLWQLTALPALRNLGLVAIAAVCFTAAVASARPFTALAIGVAAPVFAYLLYFRGALGRSPVMAFLNISVVSLAGGLAVAGLLNGLPYLIQVKQALGIKAILLVPVVAVGWLALNRVAQPRDVAAQPMRWGPALTGILLLGAVTFLVVRSGNEAPSAVSDLELRFRALLDTLLYTRPRTKEFLIGHPALVIGLFLSAKAKADPRLAAWAAVALSIGAIGQSDIVDTLCHTHTPLDVGLARVLIGLVLGGIIGALLWWPLGRSLAKAGGGN